MPSCHMCSCRPPWKPPWKWRTDAIFPRKSGRDVHRDNLSKLIFYLHQKPSMAENVGVYLRKKLERCLWRGPKAKPYCFMIMYAMDQIMRVCRAHQISNFTIVFLEMIKTLLDGDCRDPDLLELGCQTFEGFSHIDEDTPSCHQYDFLIERFAQLGFQPHSDPETQRRIRVAGINGLQGVIRKSYSSAQTNRGAVWQGAQMGLIVNSLLWNMKEQPDAILASANAFGNTTISQDGTSTPPMVDPSDVIIADSSGNDQDKSVLRSGSGSASRADPTVISETVFRDLIGRADSETLRKIVAAVLSHLDDHNDWWELAQFAPRVFRILICSCEAQYDFDVVRMLNEHLEKNKQGDARFRRALVDVILTTVVYAANEAVGTSVLEIFNVFLSHLQFSVENKAALVSQAASETTTSTELLRNERDFQNTLFNAIIRFAQKLPDFQRMEVIMFIALKVPVEAGSTAASTTATTKTTATASTTTLTKERHVLQGWLLRCIYEISCQYEGKYLTNALPDALLSRLLVLDHFVADDVRHYVQQILAILLDRRGIIKALRQSGIDVEQMTIGKNDSIELSSTSSPSKRSSSATNQFMRVSLIEDASTIVRVASTYTPISKKMLSGESHPSNASLTLSADQTFITKHGVTFYRFLFSSMLDESSAAENYEALYSVLCVICIQLGSERVLVELISLMVQIQNASLPESVAGRDPAAPPLRAGSKGLPMPHVCAIHSVVGAFTLVAAQVLSSETLLEYVRDVMETRRSQFTYFLPTFAFNRANKPRDYPEPDDVVAILNNTDLQLLIDGNRVATILRDHFVALEDSGELVDSSLLDKYFDKATLPRLIEAPVTRSDVLPSIVEPDVSSGRGSVIRPLDDSHRMSRSRASLISDISLLSATVLSRRASDATSIVRFSVLTAEQSAGPGHNDSVDYHLIDSLDATNNFCIDLNTADETLLSALRTRAERHFDDVYNEELTYLQERDAAAKKWAALTHNSGLAVRTADSQSHGRHSSESSLDTLAL